MKTVDQALVFDCVGERLVGVLTQPASPRDVAVLVIVGGPQYRVGSHRQFVQMARQLAVAGFPVLRFDVRGMGDSEGAQRSFEDLDDDIAAGARALLERQAPATRLVLWGLCDGASAALLYMNRRADPRVVGLALLNPWVRSEASLARTQVRHYYGQRLLQRAFWSKLLRGGVGLRALRGLLWSLRSTMLDPGSTESPSIDFRRRMARAWTLFNGQLLLVLSDTDYTAREFEDCISSDPCWQQALIKPSLRICRLINADHTLSSLAAKTSAHDEIARWLSEIPSR